jgi:hypothetical protein
MLVPRKLAGPAELGGTPHKPQRNQDRARVNRARERRLPFTAGLVVAYCVGLRCYETVKKVSAAIYFARAGWPLHLGQLIISLVANNLPSATSLVMFLHSTLVFAPTNIQTPVLEAVAPMPSPTLSPIDAA